MNSETTTELSDSEAIALLDSLGSSITRVLETTNSVKIKGLGAFRKSADGIKFVASEDLNSYVNADFEGLDIVSYDPGDLARSHVKREEFSFESDETILKGHQTEIISDLADVANGDDVEELAESKIVEEIAEVEVIADVETAEEILEDIGESTESIEHADSAELEDELVEANISDTKEEVLESGTAEVEISGAEETEPVVEDSSDAGPVIEAILVGTAIAKKEVIDDSSELINVPLEDSVEELESAQEQLDTPVEPEISVAEQLASYQEEISPAEAVEAVSDVENEFPISPAEIVLDEKVDEVVEMDVDLADVIIESGEKAIEQEILDDHSIDEQSVVSKEAQGSIIEIIGDSTEIDDVIFDDDENDAIVVLFDEGEDDLEVLAEAVQSGEIKKDASSEIELIEEEEVKKSDLMIDGFMGDEASPGPVFNIGDAFEDDTEDLSSGLEIDFDSGDSYDSAESTVSEEPETESHYDKVHDEADTADAENTLKAILEQTEREVESGELEPLVERTGFDAPINIVDTVKEEALPDLDELKEKISGKEGSEPAWMREEESGPTPFPTKIRKSEKAFAEKDDGEIRKRRAAAQVERQERRKRRMWFSLLGLIFFAAVLSLFWWMISSGGGSDVAQSGPAQEVREASTQTISDAEDVPRDFPRIIDYSDPGAVADLDRGKFTWILHSTNDLRDAQLKSDYYNSLDFKNDIIKVSLNGLDTYRVSFGRYNSYKEAAEADETLPYGIQGTWVDKLEDSFNSSQESN